MAKQLKLRRGTTTQHGSFTGAEGELTIDTTKDTAVVHDGSQAGGRPLLREDLNNLATGAIATAKIADDAITTAKLADDSVNSGQIADAAIDTVHIGPAQITSSLLANDSVVTDRIADDAVTTAKIAADAVTGAKIADDAINSEHYTDGSIDTAHIAADQITGALIADDAVGSEHIEVLDAALQFGDSVKAQFGAGNDLEIYHDGSNSYIQDAGTGELRLRADGGIIRITKDATETLAAFNVDGASELYHDNSKKIETTSAGVTVTGTVTDTIGDVRKLGLNAQSGDYTLVAGDAGKFIRRTGGNVTVPNSVFATGDMVTILNDDSSSMTITQGSGFSLQNTADATSGNRTLAGRGRATILFNAAGQG